VQELEKHGLDPHNMKKKLDDFESKINDNTSNLDQGIFLIKESF
jgi:hypothetical protein